MCVQLCRECGFGKADIFKKEIWDLVNSKVRRNNCNSSVSSVATNYQNGEISKSKSKKLLRIGLNVGIYVWESDGFLDGLTVGNTV